MAAVAALAVAVQIAGSASSEPSDELVRDVYRRLSLLSGERRISRGDTSFGFLQREIENFVEAQSHDETRPGTVVNPITGSPWIMRRLLVVASGDESWKGPDDSEAAREKQIRAVLDGLLWRIAAVRGPGPGQRPQTTTQVSRSAATKTTEKCNPPPAQNPQPPWTSTGQMRSEFAALLPQALNSSETESTTVARTLGISASGPPGGDESLVGVSRMVIGLPMPKAPAIDEVPVSEARVIVDASSFAKAPMRMYASAEALRAVVAPDETDWDLAGVQLGNKVPEPLALDPTTYRATYQVPTKVLVQPGKNAATDPKFNPYVVIHFAGEEPPTGWPPVQMDPAGCFWTSGYGIGPTRLIYRLALPFLADLDPPRESPEPTAEQIAANARLQGAKLVASLYFQKAFAAAEKGLVGVVGEEITGEPQGGKDAGQLAKLVGLGGNAPPTKVIAKVAAIFSIVTDVFQIVTYTTSYYAFLQAQDPPAADFDVVAHPAVGRPSARTSRVPRGVRDDAAELLRTTRAATAYFMAYLLSFERLQGAMRAGDADAQALQAAATSDNGYLFAETMSNLFAQRNRMLRSAVKAAGFKFELSPALLRKARRRVRGRPVKRAAIPMEQLGLTRAQAKHARRLAARGIRRGVSVRSLPIPDGLATRALLKRERAFVAQIRAIAADPEAYAQPAG